jgi:hypothetical protein
LISYKIALIKNFGFCAPYSASVFFLSPTFYNLPKLICDRRGFLPHVTWYSGIDTDEDKSLKEDPGSSIEVLIYPILKSFGR